jgi:hypothetical protein
VVTSKIVCYSKIQLSVLTTDFPELSARASVFLVNSWHFDNLRAIPEISSSRSAIWNKYQAGLANEKPVIDLTR